MTIYAIAEAYGDNMETVFIILCNGFQFGGKYDRSGAGDMEFGTRKDAEDYLRRLEELETDLLCEA